MSEEQKPVVPGGGRRLLEMRRIRKRPPGFIVVTERRDVAERARKMGCFPLMVEAGKSYDFSMVYGLWVVFLTHMTLEHSAPIASAILAADPGRFTTSRFTPDGGVVHDHLKQPDVEKEGERDVSR